MRLDGSGETCGLPSYPDSIRNNAAVDYMPATGKIVACGGNNLADSSTCYAFNGSDWEPLPGLIYVFYFNFILLEQLEYQSKL